MSEKKMHQLLLLCLGSCLIVFFALLFLEPILGILWFLFAALTCVILSMRYPAVWNAEKAIFQKRKERIKASMMGESSQSAQEVSASYELVMFKPQTGQRYSINKKTYLIGRGSQCDCILGGTGTIGRKHCRIVYREHSREYYIEDLRSQNGTYLGTRRLDPNTQVKLMENDEICIGDYYLRFMKRV